MYGAVMNKRIVAIHDDNDVVEEFIDNQPNSDDFTMIKIKNKKKIRSMPEYEDLYLVICDGQYVPYELYDTLKQESDAGNYDLIRCKETLYRLIEDGGLSKKEMDYIILKIRNCKNVLTRIFDCGIITVVKHHWGFV